MAVREEGEERVAEAVPVHHHAPGIALEARAEDDVGVAVEDRLDELRILVGVVFEVGVLDDDDVAARLGDAAADGRPLPLVHRLEDVADLRPLLRERRDDVARAVGRAVVDDDDLLLDRHRPHPAQQLRHRRALVVAGDDDGKEGERVRMHGARVCSWRDLETAPTGDASTKHNEALRKASTSPSASSR